jgi:L-asparagine transporter-like permease
MYWLNWAMTGIAEITAVAIHVHKWLPDVPQWITALIALGVLLAVNLLSVKLFGELESIPVPAVGWRVLSKRRAGTPAEGQRR